MNEYILKYMKKKYMFRVMAAILIMIMVFALKKVYDESKVEAPAVAAEKFKYEYTLDAEDLTELNINWLCGSINVQVGKSKNKIEIVEYTNKRLAKKERLVYETSGNALDIKWEDAWFSLSMLNSLEKDLIITVPKSFAKGMTKLNCQATIADIQLKSLRPDEMRLKSVTGTIRGTSIMSLDAEVSTNAAEVFFDKITCEKLKMKNVSGGFQINQAKIQGLELKTTSGLINVNGQVETLLKTESVSGNVCVNLAQAPAKSEVYNVSGATQVFLPDSVGFEAFYSCFTGKFESDYPETTEKNTAKKGSIRHGNESSKFFIETTSGNVELKKLYQIPETD